MKLLEKALSSLNEAKKFNPKSHLDQAFKILGLPKVIKSIKFDGLFGYHGAGKIELKDLGELSPFYKTKSSKKFRVESKCAWFFKHNDSWKFNHIVKNLDEIPDHNKSRFVSLDMLGDVDKLFVVENSLYSGDTYIHRVTSYMAEINGKQKWNVIDGTVDLELKNVPNRIDKNGES